MPLKQLRPEDTEVSWNDRRPSPVWISDEMILLSALQRSCARGPVEHLTALALVHRGLRDHHFKELARLRGSVHLRYLPRRQETRTKSRMISASHRAACQRFPPQSQPPHGSPFLRHHAELGVPKQRISSLRPASRSGAEQRISRIIISSGLSYAQLSSPRLCKPEHRSPSHGFTTRRRFASQTDAKQRIPTLFTSWIHHAV